MPMPHKTASLEDRVAKGRDWLAGLLASDDKAEYDRLYPRWNALREQWAAECERHIGTLDVELKEAWRFGDDSGYLKTFIQFDAWCDRWNGALQTQKEETP